MTKLRLYLLTGLLAAALAPMYGCGSECGPGTTEQDGQCVVVQEGCGAGTALQNKQCVVDETGCDPGTTLGIDGECIASADVCAEGTSFDQELRTCISNTDIVCGDNTEADDDGVCVPSEERCADKTVPDDTGRCVIEAAACADGTELDATTGRCVLADGACAEGLSLDADTGACVPTDELCDGGTEFDADSGLCLPGGCQEGDVLVDGICSNPAEELAHEADLVESDDNNDPALGGAAEEIALEGIGVDDDAFVFAGTIDAPADLDGDGLADQDVDAFSFEADAGQWLEVTVQSTGLPSPAFTIEGDDGYVRNSRFGGASEVARHVVIPEDGTYTLTVLPSHALEPEGRAAPGGADSWGYVGSIDVIEAAEPVDADISDGSVQLAGQLATLTDNFFNLDGADDTDTLRFEATALGGGQARGVIEVWADPDTHISSHPISESGTATIGVPSTGSALVLVDWIWREGPDDAFEIRTERSGSQTITPVADGQTESLTVDADIFDRLRVGQTNSDGASLDVVVKNPAGEQVFGRRLGSGEEAATLLFDAGEFSVEVSNNSGVAIDAHLMTHVASPNELGPIAAGETATSSAIDVPGGDSVYYEIGGGVDELLMLTHDNDELSEVDLTVYDRDGAILSDFPALEARSSQDFGLGDYKWVHLRSAEPVLVEMTRRFDRTDATLTAEKIAPSYEGEVSVDDSLHVTNDQAIPSAESAFYLLDVDGTDVGVGGVLTATDGAFIDAYLYDDEGRLLAGNEGYGQPLPFGAVSEDGGTYLVEVRCDDPCNGFDLTLMGYPPVEDLGEPTTNQPTWSSTIPGLLPAQTHTVEFSSPADRIIELARGNENTVPASVGLTLFDADGTQLFHEAFFYGESYPSYGAFPQAHHHHTAAGGDFSVLLEGGMVASVSERVKVRLIEPHKLGALTEDPASTHTDTTELGQQQWYVHAFEVPDDAQITGVSTPLGSGGEQINMQLMTPDLTTIWSENGVAGSPVEFDVSIEDGGEYLMVSECATAAGCEGVEFEAQLAAAAD